jgi:hypothetical protein
MHHLQPFIDPIGNHPAQPSSQPTTATRLSAIVTTDRTAWFPAFIRNLVVRPTDLLRSLQCGQLTSHLRARFTAFITACEYPLTFFFPSLHPGPTAQYDGALFAALMQPWLTIFRATVALARPAGPSLTFFSTFFPAFSSGPFDTDGANYFAIQCGMAPDRLRASSRPSSLTCGPSFAQPSSPAWLTFVRTCGTDTALAFFMTLMR